MGLVFKFRFGVCRCHNGLNAHDCKGQTLLGGSRDLLSKVATSRYKYS